MLPSILGLWKSDGTYFRRWPDAIQHMSKPCVFWPTEHSLDAWMLSGPWVGHGALAERSPDPEDRGSERARPVGGPLPRRDLSQGYRPHVEGLPKGTQNEYSKPIRG